MNALAAWMDTNWHSEIDIGKSEIHKLIVELDFPVIYTTNYDRLLEMAYDYYKKPYQKITKVSDIADADPAVPHIVKYHGDFDDPQSLVLTESDYFGRLDFESPLDIRLRADLLGKSVLYIGYSLTDINIRYLLYRLQRLWEVARSRTATPSSFVFLSRPNLIADRVLRDRSVVPLVSNAIDPEEGLLDFLNSLNDGQKST